MRESSICQNNLSLGSPFVNVIINCYNGEKYLREAIDSVYAQTYKNWEIIFFDNCSSDSSAQIAKSYDGKIKYYSSKNEVLPLYSARNKALKCCDAEVIAFLDADDIWMPDKLEKQIAQFLEGSPIVYGGFMLVNEFGDSIHNGIIMPPPGRMLERLLCMRNPISIGSVIVAADLVKEYMFDPSYDLLGDFDLWVRISLKHPIVGVPQIVEKSRQHGSNASKMKKNMWIYEERYFYKKLIRMISPRIYYLVGVYIIRAELKNIFRAALRRPSIKLIGRK